MGTNSGRPGSIVSTYKVVNGGLSVIKSRSEQLLSEGTLDEAHIDALTFVRTATYCLLKTFQDIKKCTDLSTIASQVHNVARLLEVRLADPDKPERVRQVILSTWRQAYGRLSSAVWIN